MNGSSYESYPFWFGDVWVGKLTQKTGHSYLFPVNLGEIWCGCIDIYYIRSYIYIYYNDTAFQWKTSILWTVLHCIIGHFLWLCLCMNKVLRSDSHILWLCNCKLVLFNPLHDFWHSVPMFIGRFCWAVWCRDQFHEHFMAVKTCYADRAWFAFGF